MKKLKQAYNLVHIIVKKKGRVYSLASNRECITIGTISGGIVNFGGAVYIAPISVTKTVSGSGEANQGEDVTTESGPNSSTQNTITRLMDKIRRSI
jgi:Spore germination protein gerPA/gerPF